MGWTRDRQCSREPLTPSHLRSEGRDSRTGRAELCGDQPRDSTSLWQHYREGVRATKRDRTVLSSLHFPAGVEPTGLPSGHRAPGRRRVRQGSRTKGKQLVRNKVPPTANFSLHSELIIITSLLCIYPERFCV